MKAGQYRRRLDETDAARKEPALKPARVLVIHQHTGHAEETGRGAEDELRTLVVRLLEAREEERQSIAQDFHDKAGQSMTLLCLLLAQAKESASAKGKADLDQAQQLVMELAAQLREMWMRLRPSILDDVGLAPALQWYSRDFFARTRVKVRLEQRRMDREIPPEIRTAAYRIVEEALTNVACHAGAKSAYVLTESDRNVLRIRVRDDGVGFDPQDIPSRCAGLRTIQERVRHLDGTVSLESSPGKGTHLLVELPLGSASSRA